MTFKELQKEYPWHFWIWIILSLSTVIFSVFRFFLTELDDFFLEIRLSNTLFLFILVYISGIIIKDLLGKKWRAFKKFTSIEQNSDFWDGGNYKELNINALNGLKIIEQVTVNKRIVVKKIFLIVPCENSIKTYFESDNIVDNKVNSISIATNSIQETMQQLKNAKSNGFIEEFEIKKISSFPLLFYAILDTKKCMVGCYLKNTSRSTSIGLKSNCWSVNDNVITGEYKDQFENLWNAAT